MDYGIIGICVVIVLSFGTVLLWKYRKKNTNHDGNTMKQQSLELSNDTPIVSDQHELIIQLEQLTAEAVIDETKLMEITDSKVLAHVNNLVPELFKAGTTAGNDVFDHDDYRKGPEIAREAGLFIENIHTPVQKQNDLWLDNLDGKTLADCYLQCVKDCAEFDIPTMVIHLPDDDNLYNTLGLDRIKRIAEKAEQLGVNVAFENLWNLTNLAYVLEHVNSPNIGFCYDCCHHYNNSAAGNLLSMYGSRLMALHLHDNGGSRSQHQLPFDGNIDWPVVMNKIAETKYSGAIALEPMNWDYKDLSAEKFLQEAFERVKRLEVLNTL